jgi:hypothetical protein
MAKRVRTLMEIKVRSDGTSAFSLPLGGATRKESEGCAIAVMRVANAQLDYVGSEYRLVVFDVKTGTRMGISGERQLAGDKEPANG